MLSHDEVATRFVAGKVAKGARMNCDVSILGSRMWSYGTEIARIPSPHYDTLLLTSQYYSPSTQRHKSYVANAWGRRNVAKGRRADDGVYRMHSITNTCHASNMRHWLAAANAQLPTVLNRRCKPLTRDSAYRSFEYAVLQGTRQLELPLDTYYPPTAAQRNTLAAYTELLRVVPAPEHTVSNPMGLLTAENYLCIEAVRALQG